MIRYLHIGYPKCGSTALQSGFFAIHPQLHHLGASGGGTRAPYLSSALRSAVEADLRLSKDFMYNATRVQRVFREEFLNAETLGRQAVGLSSESMSFTMHHDVDVTQKAARLHQIFGEGTRVVIVIRNQVELLTSLYREYVICGISLDFQDFVEAIYFNQFRSFLHDLDFWKMHGLYADLFGAENVLLLRHEDMKAHQQQLLDALSAHLGVSSSVGSLAEANVGLRGEVIEALRRINATSRRNCNRSVLEPVGGYRFMEHYEDVLRTAPPAFVLEDEEAINTHLGQAHRRVEMHGGPPVQYQCNKALWDRVLALYAAGNRRLEAVTGLRLRDTGYP